MKEEWARCKGGGGQVPPSWDVLKCKHCKGVPAALGFRSQKKVYFAKTVFVLLTIGRRVLRLHFLLARLTLSQPGIAEQTQQLAQ